MSGLALGIAGAGTVLVLLVPVLLVLAAVVCTLPGRGVHLRSRSPHVPDPAVRGRRCPAGRGGDRGTDRGRWWSRRSRAPAPADLGVVLTEVAARLQAGASPAQAWQRALPGDREGQAVTGPVVDDEGVPVGLPDLVPARRRSGRAGQQRLALQHQVLSTQVACRMAHTVGAPLAQVLQASAAGVAEAGRAQADRRAALAAPRATARLLGWLPVAALVLGSAWGAAPVQVLLDGGWGTLCLVLGGTLMVVGHVWSGRLVRAAEQAGL